MLKFVHYFVIIKRNKHPFCQRSVTLNQQKHPPAPSRPRPRRRRGPSLSLVAASLLAIICVFLAIVTAIASLRVTQLKKDIELAEAQHQTAMTEMQQKLDETIATTIPVDDFKAYAGIYNVNTEFIQKFFPDKVVYKDDAVIYAPIDPELPKHDYDWSYLDRTDGLYSYKDKKYTAKLGVDVSRFQGSINWEAVAGDGVRFAILRMGYRGYVDGMLMTDPCFTQNINGALNNGIEVGVYFFSQAITPEEAVEEAEYLLKAIEGYNVTMPVVFDMEIVAESADARANSLTPEERTAITKAFCARIAEAGHDPMIYGNTAWLLAKLQWKELQDYPVWLAQYTREPCFPYKFSMWQYTCTGKVNGIEGDVDLNLCFASGW